MHIPGADHRHVFRHPQPRFEQRLYRADGYRIVITKDAVRTRICFQQLLHGLVPGLVLKAGVYHVIGGRFHLVFFQRGPIAIQTFSGEANVRTP